MSVIRQIISGLDFSILTDILLAVVPALLCISLHELAHGYVAYKLGDDTAKRQGRLTLNPIKHIDPMGLIMMVVFKFGWAKPVPVNMMKFENPKKGMAIVAVAGPLMNVLITVVALFFYGLIFKYTRTSDIAYYTAQILVITAQLSIYFALFNIIPIPPLDGSKVLFSLMDDRSYIKLMYIERYGMLVLMAFIFIMNSLDVNYLATVSYGIFDKLFVIAEFSYGLVT